VVYRGRSFAAAAAVTSEFGLRSRVRVRVSVGRVRGARVRSFHSPRRPHSAGVRLLRSRQTGRVPTPVQRTLLLRFAVRTRRRRRRLRERTRFPILRRPRGPTTPKNQICRTAVTTVLGIKLIFKNKTKYTYNLNDPRRWFYWEDRFDRFYRAGGKKRTENTTIAFLIVNNYYFTPYLLFTYVCVCVC